MKLRLILLDGTYSDADKLARHLEQLLHTYECPSPLVKLDLDDGNRCPCTHTDIHTCILAYIHTYIHTYDYAYI